MTFTELYQQSVKAPTPRQVFLKKIQQATGKSSYTVRSWAEGIHIPREDLRDKIGKALGMDTKELFPEGV